MSITQQIIGQLPREEFVPQFSRYLNLLAYKDLFKGKRVLDLACGSGYGSYFIARHLEPAEVVGVDADTEAIAYAKRTFGHPLITYRPATSTEFAQDETYHNYFDIIVTYETIEHVSDPGQFMDELLMLAKPSCQMFLSTPNKEVVSPYVKYPIFRYHIHEFIQHELVELLEHKGLTVQQLELERTPKSAALTVRTILCWFGSIVPSKATSRLLETVFHWLKQLLPGNREQVVIDRSVVEQYTQYQTTPVADGVPGGFFIVLTRK